MTERDKDEFDSAEEEPAAEFPEHVDADVPEADALEQSRDWGGGPKKKLEPKIPIDVPEADALEQAQDAWEDEDDRR